MMVLEVNSMASFLEEVGNEKVRLTEVDMPLQDEKGDAMTGALIVLTCRIACNHDDFILKFVENMGTAYNNDRESKNALDKLKDEKLKEVVKCLDDAKKTYGIGMWSVE